MGKCTFNQRQGGPPETKKPTFQNTPRYSSTSAYLLTSPPARPACTSNSLPANSMNPGPRRDQAHTIRSIPCSKRASKQASLTVMDYGGHNSAGFCSSHETGGDRNRKSGHVSPCGNTRREIMAAGLADGPRQGAPRTANKKIRVGNGE